MPLEVGILVHFSARCIIGSALSHLVALSDSEFSCIGVGTVSAYDETPMKLNVPSKATDLRRFRESETSVLVVDDRPPLEKRPKKETETCKILQSDHKILVLLKNKTSKRLMGVCFPIAPPLQITDSCTGAVLVKFLKEQMHVPMLEALRSRALFDFDVATCDRGSSNLLAEAALAQESLMRHRLTLHCNLHIGHTVQGKQYDPIQRFISGILAFALAQRSSGSSAKFRQALQLVLSKHCVPVHAARPAADDPRTVHRDRMLDLFLSTSVLDKQRKVSLKVLLTGDVTQDTINWFTNQEHPDKEKWAEKVAWNLYPHMTPLFPRSRWLKSHCCLNEVGLLCNIHNLYRNVVAVWCALVQNKPVGPLLKAPNVEPVESGSDGDEEAEMPDRGSFLKDGQMDWSAYNEAQRGCALRLSKQDPGPTAIVARISLAPMVDMFRVVLDMGGREWELRSLRDAAKSGQFRTRILECHKGKLSLPLFGSINNLLLSPAMWLALPSRCHTANFQALGFAMLARCAAGIFQLMHSPQSGFPCRLWRLLDQHGADADAIKHAPVCMQDSWTKSFLKTWPEASDLLSTDARGLLTIIGAHASLDIGPTECRHATIRRCIRGRVQTHSMPLTRASADFVTLRHCLAAACCCSNVACPHATHTLLVSAVYGLE
jgi:hypothetical protein